MNLLEALNGFADVATNLGQVLWPENEGSNPRNDHELGHTESKQGVARERLMSSSSSSCGWDSTTHVKFVEEGVREG